MSDLKITIVTPSFNQAKFLRETLRSVLDQDYTSIEYMVIDGGSTDGSVELIKSVSHQLAFWCSEPDRGQSHAINKGLDRATGDIVCWINSDDLLEPSALSIVSSYFASDPELGALVGTARAINEIGRPIAHGPASKENPDGSLRFPPSEIGRECFEFWTEDWFAQPAVFWRRSVMERVGSLREDLHYSMDYEFWRRLAKASKFRPVPEVLGICRYYPECKSVRDSYRSFLEVAKVNSEEMCLEELQGFVRRSSVWLAERARIAEIGRAEALVQLERAMGSRPMLLAQWLKRLVRKGGG